METENTIFFIWVVWFFYTYGPPSFLFNLFLRFSLVYDDFFNYCNKFLYPEYWKEDDIVKSEEQNNNDVINEEQKSQPKYEDKYLDDIRQLNKEWVFTEEENEALPRLAEDYFNNHKTYTSGRIEEITKEIINLEKQISQDNDEDTINYVEDFDDLEDESTLEERNEKRNKQIQLLRDEYNELKLAFDTEEGLVELKNKTEKLAKEHIINNRLNKLKNCHVIEKTPTGNVLMIYNIDNGSFKYYSDYSVPYRYLEVVGRKYVKLFNCRPIFVDMEEELKLFDEKWEREQELKKMKEEDNKKRLDDAIKNQQQIPEVKKNVFAKFKSYNKEAGGKISMAPPKNSISHKNTTETAEDKKVLLKERANRYTYEGKFANFNFLQKYERKIFDRKLAISFADFKKMQKK